MLVRICAYLLPILLAGCMKPQTIVVSQMHATAPPPMVARKSEVPLFVSIAEVSDRISTDGRGGQDRIVHLTDLKALVRRDLKQALEGLFESVTVVEQDGDVPDMPHYFLAVRIQAAGTAASGESRTEQSVTGSGTVAYLTGRFWFDWAAGLRAGEADEFQWSQADRTESPMQYAKNAEAPGAVNSALSLIIKTIVEGVYEALREEAEGDSAVEHATVGGDNPPPPVHSGPTEI